jgi:peptide-methionine (S)-S-oxide reductase
MLASIALASTAPRVALDPLTLLADRSAQKSTLLPPDSQKPGLEVATIACGWFWHPEGALAALPGVRHTCVGYCGGAEPDPTYQRVCSNPKFSDYAEAIRIEFDPTVLSYVSLLDAFFHCHDALAGSSSRQYSSIIFAHDETQAAAAAEAVSARPRATTSVEAIAPFFAAEPYHQKWLLQRKRDLMLALSVGRAEELILGAPATVLNAVAAGKLPGRVAMQRLDVLLAEGELSASVHGTVAAFIDPF